MKTKSEAIVQQAVLADFGIEAFAATDFTALQDRAVSLVSGGLSDVAVLLLEKRTTGPGFVVRAEHGWAPGAVPTILPDEDGPAGLALRALEPVVVNDLNHSPLVPTIPQFMIDNHMKSVAAVPIRTTNGDGGIGALEVCSPVINEFNDDDAHFLTCYANLLAAAADRLRITAELTETIKYKDILLAELQHRVKNNLQIIISLVNQQRRSMSSDLTVITSRIEALRIIYDKLQLTNHHGKVEMGSYVRDLVECLINLETMLSKRITMDVNTDHVMVDIDRAVPVGLIISEFVMNSLKYAFTNNRGVLTVNLKRVSDKVSLLLADDGPGIGQNYGRGTGINLISQLADQADAQMTWHRPAVGTCLEVMFSPEPIR